MNLKSSVTVIVPVFNAELHIRKCLESLLHQTDNSFDVICIDDCSQDDSCSLLKAYVPLFQGRMRVFSNEKNLGGGASRMLAVNMAETQYVTFLDSDDYVSDDYIQMFCEETSSSPDIIVAGYTKDYGAKMELHGPVAMPWCLTTYSISCAKMYKREFLCRNRVGFSSIRCGEDILFGLELFSLRPKVKVIDYCGYYYTFNDKSTTNTMREGMERNVAEIFSQFSSWVKADSLDGYQWQVIEYTYFANMINALVVYSRKCGRKTMDDKLTLFFEDYKTRFPDLFSNPLLRFKNAKGQSMKIRLSVAIMAFLNKFGLDRFVYKIFSL